jgi:NAD(P)-dependent dehydrogenase (short-subunit alcohol dehydrogenase family)
VASTNELFSLRNRTFLITGGTRGIGRAISLRFARAGARVIANYLRDETAATQTKDIAANEALDITLCRADLAIDRGLEQLNGCLEERGLKLAGMVHCAATGVHHHVEELTERHFDWTLNLNTKVFLRLVKMLLPRLETGSSIVAMSSWGALRTLPYYSLVGASKGALEALARHFAVELASRGIRVNILTPGTVITDAWKALPEREARIEDAVRRTPLGRLITPDEIASAAQFLCSDAASGIIGQTIIVDGGIGIVA